jgi:hypothetical protein|tara:strand:- start:138 stop:425 length:288 start_codon:yes stop_codon:yes gene_type:complete
MKNKKSDVAVAKLIGLALGMIALVIMGIFIYQKIKQGSDETESLLFSTRDSDEDGIPDFKDRCDCVVGNEDNDGCPTVNPTSTDKNKNDCKAPTT